MSADARGMDDIYFQCGVTTRAPKAGDAHDTEVRMEKVHIALSDLIKI